MCFSGFTETCDVVIQLLLHLFVYIFGSASNCVFFYFLYEADQTVVSLDYLEKCIFFLWEVRRPRKKYEVCKVSF